MNRNNLRFALLLALAACSCRRLVPSPSESTSGPAPVSSEPVAPAPTPIPAPIPPLSDNARTEDERNTIAGFRDSAAAGVFVTPTPLGRDYPAGPAPVHP